MYKKMLIGTILATLLFSSCSKKEKEQKNTSQNFMNGIDVLLKDSKRYLENKKVGIITNQTGVTKDSVHIVDTLNNLKICDIVSLFAPEHGIRGEVEAGKRTRTYDDEKTGLKVWSLYGKNKKPTDNMIKGIDLLMYDIQDIGARFYTYISTLGLAMEKAAEKNIPFYVLDRQNPISGSKVEGPVLKEGFRSFIGKYTIPIRYGLTVGELAKMINEEGWIKKRCDLKIIKLEGWNRDKYQTDLNAPWVNPSPNIPDVFTAMAYPGLCLLEGTNVSEGRGTDAPFFKIGAPWIDRDNLIMKLKQYDLPGIDFVPKYFVPVSIPGVASRPKYENETCAGVELLITDKDKFNSVQTGIHILYAINSIHPDKLKTNKGLDRLFGSDALSKALMSRKTPKRIIDDYKQNLDDFLELRQNYLMY